MLSDEQADRIKALIDAESPRDLGLPHALWTRRAIGDLIRKESGIDLANRTVGLYLSRWGCTPKKPSHRSRQQDPDEVDDWLNETYPLIEEQAKQEDADISWTDEVGVQADHCPGTSYAPEGERAEADMPRPHLRTSQATAISNQGEARSMDYDGMMAGAVFLSFPQALVADAPRKILLIADQPRAHGRPQVEAWLEENEDRIEMFHLPACSPQLDPVEHLNNDMKGQVNKAGMLDSKGGLRENLMAYMGFLAKIPSRVIGFFLHLMSNTPLLLNCSSDFMSAFHAGIIAEVVQRQRLPHMQAEQEVSALQPGLRRRAAGPHLENPQPALGFRMLAIQAGRTNRSGLDPDPLPHRSRVRVRVRLDAAEGDRGEA